MGGFLGLGNINVFDRSAPLPTGGYLEQADGASWVAMFGQNLLEIAVELAANDPTSQDMATKFVDHFLFTGRAMNTTGPDGMWDEEDGFYHDVLRFPDGSARRLKVRSMVGLLPLTATMVIEPWQRERGPIWMPVNALLIRGLLQFYSYCVDNFKIECPTGSGNLMNLFEVAHEISNRLERIFLRDKSGRRPVYGGTDKFQTDPNWKDCILFYEYFHGDNGAGFRASHQTGWTGVVAKLIELFGRLDGPMLLAGGKAAAFAKAESEK